MKKYLSIASWLAGPLVLVIALIWFESDLLWKIQQFNLFLSTPLFFKQMMVTSGGFLTYVASYFTQYFYRRLTFRDLRFAGDSWCEERPYFAKCMALAKKIVEYGWILAVVTSASPIMDGSFFTQGLKEHDAFIGMGSVRCGDLGYWNHFVPVLDYKNVLSYAASIRRYVDMGLIVAPTELYYPIRLKPRGLNNLERLCGDGIDHIELRMFDLNPSAPLGIDSRDLEFAHLLILYLLSLPDFDLTPELQEKAVRDHKEAALFEPDAKLLMRAAEVTEEMERHFSGNEKALEIISFEKGKIMGNTYHSSAVMDHAL